LYNKKIEAPYIPETVGDDWMKNFDEISEDGVVGLSMAE